MPSSRDTSKLRPTSHSRSVSRRRPDVGPRSASYVPPEAATLPEGPVDEDTAEALHEFVHPHHHAEQTLVEETEHEHVAEEQRKRLPWWRRPSPWWFICMIPFTAIATTACLAPRLEMYTKLVCEAHRPEYSSPQDRVPPEDFYSLPSVYNDGIDMKQCASDPVVGAAVAQLNMVITILTGIVGCLTTGWWSALSDRYGRIFVLGIGVVGLIYTDFNFILVSTYNRVLPGGYWLYIVGGVVDGLVGALPTSSAAIHAYAADCTEPNGRARIFSLFVGLMFSGTAAGPTLGGLLVSYSRNLLVVFYLALAIHFAYACMVWFVIPESLPKSKMEGARRAHAERLTSSIPWPKRIFGFLSPLNVLFDQPEGHTENPLKRKRNYNLPLIALSYGCSTMLYGSYSYKFLYVSDVWGWTSKQIGYWLSIIGTTRAVFLAIIFPGIIHLFKPREPPIQLPIDPDEPLQPTSTSPEASRPGPSSSSGSSPTLQPPPAISSPSATSSASTLPPTSKTLQARVLRFDLTLARISLFIETVSFIAMPFSPNPIVFSAITMLTCFGAGFGPAIQSVASILYAENGGTESGKLFGAISVIQSLCTSIFGPALFGLTYMKTVATMPAAIFFVSATVITASFIALSMVRLPRIADTQEAFDLEDAPEPDIAVYPISREDTLVGVEPTSENSELRGRKASET